MKLIALWLGPAVYEQFLGFAYSENICEGNSGASSDLWSGRKPDIIPQEGQPGWKRLFSSFLEVFDVAWLLSKATIRVISIENMLYIVQTLHTGAWIKLCRLFTTSQWLEFNGGYLIILFVKLKHMSLTRMLIKAFPFIQSVPYLDRDGDWENCFEYENTLQTMSSSGLRFSVRK